MNSQSESEVIPNAGWLRLIGLLAAFASVASMFISWMTFEIPLKNNRIELYPWVFVGGRAFAIIYCLTIFVGVVIFVSKKPIGILIVAVPASVVAWFAFAVIVISSIFDNFVGVFGQLIRVATAVDTGEPGAWIGQGPGLVIAVVSGLLLGVVAVLHFQPLSTITWDRGDLSETISTAVILIALLVSSQNTWVTAEIIGHQFRLRIQGDQLFGSAIVDGILWMAIGLWALSALVKVEGLRKLVQIATAIGAVLRLLQCGFVFAGTALLRKIMPGSIEIGDSVHKLPSLYFASALSVISILFAFSAFFSIRLRQGVWAVASATLILISVLALIGII